MSWNYTNKGLCQLNSLGRVLTLLGAVMLVFGDWLYVVNTRLAGAGVAQVPFSRRLEMAMPAAFGLAVLVLGITVWTAGRHRQRAS